ncbi:hypothetical protein ROZALSC1DRAFT_24965 [Rozella allomycis CSF55]|uniref:Uncharacterized protein n=1 Tax=Rozella allomycis (strain CSF55) TaxID=988480 RepID=A0A4P9YBR8_ROZAC|nr:hypothetical protein ROZALSC1DRAFT_24965 [Rozella allomycis CSF55]
MRRTTMKLLSQYFSGLVFEKLSIQSTMNPPESNQRISSFKDIKDSFQSPTQDFDSSNVPNPDLGAPTIDGRGNDIREFESTGRGCTKQVDMDIPDPISRVTQNRIGKLYLRMSSHEESVDLGAKPEAEEFTVPVAEQEEDKESIYADEDMEEIVGDMDLTKSKGPKLEMIGAEDVDEKIMVFARIMANTWRIGMVIWWCLVG